MMFVSFRLISGANSSLLYHISHRIARVFCFLSLKGAAGNGGYAGGFLIRTALALPVHEVC
ncbi:MAG: hypothetical protein ACI4WV_02980, partial [Eubacteriales bacterium]